MYLSHTTHTRTHTHTQTHTDTHPHTHKHTLTKEYSSQIYLYEKTNVIFVAHIGYIHESWFFYEYDFYT